MSRSVIDKPKATSKEKRIETISELEKLCQSSFLTLENSFEHEQSSGKSNEQFMVLNRI